MTSARFFSLLLVLSLSFTGCSGPSVEVIEVTGTITQNGNPLEEVKVVFTPDPASVPQDLLAQGAAGQSSMAITDAQGKYRLKYRGDAYEFGAEVGTHIILAIDVMAENSRDNPMPPRIARKYSVASQTDVSFEAKSGEPAVFDFELEGRK